MTIAASHRQSPSPDGEDQQPHIPQQRDLVDRTVKSLQLLRWLITHHEHHDGAPLGLATQQLTQIRMETEQLIHALEPPDGHSRHKSPLNPPYDVQ